MFPFWTKISVYKGLNIKRRRSTSSDLNNYCLSFDHLEIGSELTMDYPLDNTSDRPLRSLVRNDLLVPRSRTSTSQQCGFASAGPLLWNCLLVKTRAQILSSSLSSTPRLLKSFLFPGAYRTGGRL